MAWVNWDVLMVTHYGKSYPSQNVICCMVAIANYEDDGGEHASIGHARLIDEPTGSLRQSQLSHHVISRALCGVASALLGM